MPVAYPRGQWWVHDSSSGTPKAKHRGSADINLGSSFTLETTLPTYASGLTGVQVAESSLATVSGNAVMTGNGQTIEGKLVTGNTSFSTYSNCTFRNCIVQLADVPAAGGTTKYAAFNGFGGSGNLIEFCEVRPVTPTVDCYGVDGCGMTIQRCYIHDVVDAFNSQKNSANTVAGLKIYGNRIVTVLYSSDPRQGGGASHSDGLQVFAGAGEFIGNYLTGPTNSGNGIVFNPTGSLPSAVAVKNWVIRSNWIDGCYTQISAWMNGSAYFDTIPGLDIWNNRHIGTAASSGGSHRWDVLLTQDNNDAATRIGQGYRYTNATDPSPTLRTTGSNPPYPYIGDA